MAIVTLPLSPAPAAISWEPIDFGGNTTSALGGSTQRVNRLGNRWKLTVSMPPLVEEQARHWAASLSRGLRRGVAFKVRQPGFSRGAPGLPLVAGSGQLGETLNLRGLTPHYFVRAGQWVSIITGGKRYLYQVAENAITSDAGLVTLEIEPALRVSPADNDTVEMGSPYIEGLLEAPQGWQFDVDQIARGFSFVIAETR